jgi:hypothetical protein
VKKLLVLLVVACFIVSLTGCPATVTTPAKIVKPSITPPGGLSPKTDGKTESGKTDGAAPKTEPAKTEPAKTEPAKTEPAKTEPAKTEPKKTEK